MIDDFRPAPRPAKSLRDALDEAPKTKTPQSQDESDPFQTPESVAAQDTPGTPSAATPIEADKSESAPAELKSVGAAVASENFQSDHKEPKAPKPGLKAKLHLSWPPGKKEYIVAAAALVVLGGGGFAAWHFMHHPKPAAVVQKPLIVKKQLPPAPTTVPSTLTGLPVAPSINSLPVTGVMIENSDFARPQSGLGDAGVVFEAIAEGGITRFLALFQDTAPANVGPIRSARPYYEQWALGFDAGYAHVGGSPEALADINTWSVRDLNQFYNGSYYHRISTRAAPHNVYTGIPTLQQLETKKGYTSSTYTGFPRKTDAPSKTPNAATVKLTLSGPDYNVLYNYDAAANAYKRNEGGAPHIDANTNAQIEPKVVVAMVIHYSLEPDHYHSDYAVIGSGPVYVFQDGTVTAGQWTKSGNSSQISFTNADGSPLKLNAGKTWITAVAATNDVNYTP